MEPEAIHVTWGREANTHEELITEWLIVWKAKPIEEAMWEEESNIRSQFPSFCLEDKATFQADCIDRNVDLTTKIIGPKKALIVYSCRPKGGNSK